MLERIQEIRCLEMEKPEPKIGHFQDELGHVMISMSLVLNGFLILRPLSALRWHEQGDCSDTRDVEGDQRE